MVISGKELSARLKSEMAERLVCYRKGQGIPDCRYKEHYHKEARFNFRG